MHFDQERNQLISRLQSLSTFDDVDRSDYILSLFHFQYKYNRVYRQYCNNLGLNESDVGNISQIPLLPISAFKYQTVKTGAFEAQEVFKSSGTTGMQRSTHDIRDVSLYLRNTEQIWNHYYGDLSNYCFLALLPGYLERDGSSLIHMVHHFISKSAYHQSGFYLRNHDALYAQLKACHDQNVPTVLFGVTYALLDFMEEFKVNFPKLTIIETGGMKGNRVELTKSTIHQALMAGFGVEQIVSEYGMTELMSQAYSKGGVFDPNPWFQIYTRQINDPLELEKSGKTGLMGIHDMANIDSCAFILTDDLGILNRDGSFEIQGRVTAADIRGCNLMLSEM